MNHTQLLKGFIEKALSPAVKSSAKLNNRDLSLTLMKDEGPTVLKNMLLRGPMTPMHNSREGLNLTLNNNTTSGSP